MALLIFFHLPCIQNCWLSPCNLFSALLLWHGFLAFLLPLTMCALFQLLNKMPYYVNPQQSLLCSTELTSIVLHHLPWFSALSVYINYLNYFLWFQLLKLWVDSQSKISVPDLSPECAPHTFSRPRDVCKQLEFSHHAHTWAWLNMSKRYCLTDCPGLLVPSLDSRKQKGKIILVFLLSSSSSAFLMQKTVAKIFKQMLPRLALTHSKIDPTLRISQLLLLRQQSLNAYRAHSASAFCSPTQPVDGLFFLNIHSNLWTPLKKHKLQFHRGNKTPLLSFKLQSQN